MSHAPSNEKLAPLQIPDHEESSLEAWDFDVRMGSVLGKYRLLLELGQGGMANVFLAVARGHSGFHKLVVLKMLRPSLAKDPQFLTMFLDEGRLAARLNHPNVVQTNEVGLERDRYLIAMEYLEGQPLSKVIHRAKQGGTPLPLALHLRILADTLAGLHYAHELADFDGTALQLVHRDVSPQNIFVTYDGQVKVLDFGIAKASTSTTHTVAGVLKGKFGYMAPEQFAGEPMDRRTDVYAMGVLLWEALTGQRSRPRKLEGPLPGLTTEMPTPSSLRPDIDPRLDAICQRALAHDPKQRFETAAQMQEELETVLAQQSGRRSARDLGRFVEQLFKEERSTVKVTLERQLAAATRLPTGEYQALGFATTLNAAPFGPGGTGSHSGSHASHQAAAAGGHPGAMPSGSHPQERVPGAHGTAVSPVGYARAPGSDQGGFRSASVPPQGMSHTVPPGEQRGRGPLVAATAALLAVGVGLLFAVRLVLAPSAMPPVGVAGGPAVTAPPVVAPAPDPTDGPRGDEAPRHDPAVAAPEPARTPPAAPATPPSTHGPRTPRGTAAKDNRVPEVAEDKGAATPPPAPAASTVTPSRKTRKFRTEL